jgi:hypothetical protein
MNKIKPSPVGRSTQLTLALLCCLAHDVHPSSFTLRTQPHTNHCKPTSPLPQCQHTLDIYSTISLPAQFFRLHTQNLTPHTLIYKLLTHPNYNTIHPPIQPSNQPWPTLPPHPSPNSNPSSHPPTPAQKAIPSCPPAPKPRAPSPRSPKPRTTTSPAPLCSRPATTNSKMIALTLTSRTKKRASGLMRSSWTTRVRVDARGPRLRRGGSE